ncbi:MAG: penicillin-binding protein 2 [Alphaproteobacteria bacterium]|nr:penicillin-binding protein 2 [Alphaproteobacteria bacterium]
MSLRAENDRQIFFTRRALVLGAVKLGVAGVLAGRLYYLQVVRSGEFVTLSDSNRIKLQLILPPRGRILDRFGEQMAYNKVNYRCVFNMEQGQEVKAVISHVSKLLEMSPQQEAALLKEAKALRPGNTLLLKEYLSWEELSRIEVNAPDLPSVHIDLGQVRYYPDYEGTAHILGHVGAVSEEESDGSPLHRQPEFRHGKSGVEKHFERELVGKPGVKRVEMDAHGLLVRELAREESVAGEDVTLSIDMRLQNFTVKRIGEESASVVVMDVRSGEVLTLASMPAFDPNRFSQGIKPDYWKSLLNNEKHPLINKALAGQYPPGSIFKMIVALAGLKAGVSEHNTSYCPGYLAFGSHVFRCWKKEGHGTVDMHNALSWSCDVYFYQLAHRLGVDAIAEMARKFGMGELTGIEIPGEKSGIAPTEAWKRKRYNQPWLGGETLNVGIGQGYVLVTPLQMALMAARLANGGYAVKPSILKAGAETPTEWPKLGVPKSHLELVQEGMRGVMAPGGTAHRSQIPDEQFHMAGKTGTAQVVKINHNRPKGAWVPWNERHHAWFVAYAPNTTPHYACAVLVEHGDAGSKAAAPIARDVLWETQKLDPCNRFRKETEE